MLAEFLALIVGSSEWRWLVVIVTAIVAAVIVELLVRKAISATLAGASAIISGSFVATIVGYLLFPPIMVSSPDSTTFSIVGAAASSVYWVLLRRLLQSANGLKPTDYLLVCPTLVVSGIVAGTLVGLLSSGPLFGLLLGLMGSLLLTGPYFLVAFLERRRKARALPATAEKAMDQSSGNAKAPRE